MPLAIIYRPQFDKPMPRRGQQVFLYPVSEAKRKGGKIEEIQVESLTLQRGTNFIDSSQWEQVLAHPINKEAVLALSRKQVIATYAPDAEVASGDTTDYQDPNAVADIIAECSDVKWLERSRSRESRLEIEKLITQRLNGLEEDRKVRQYNLAGQGMGMGYSAG